MAKLSSEQIEHGRKDLLRHLRDRPVEYRDLFVRLWETAADELCDCPDYDAVSATGSKILDNWESYGLSRENAKELARIIRTRTVYKNFEESLPGFQAEMLRNHEMLSAQHDEDRERFLNLSDSISAWRQWWLEHSGVRSMTDFNFGVAVLKMTIWLVGNDDS